MQDDKPLLYPNLVSAWRLCHLYSIATLTTLAKLNFLFKFEHSHDMICSNLHKPEFLHILCRLYECSCMTLHDVFFTSTQSHPMDYSGHFSLMPSVSTCQQSLHNNLKLVPISISISKTSKNFLPFLAFPVVDKLTSVLFSPNLKILKPYGNHSLGHDLQISSRHLLGKTASPEFRLGCWT